MAKALGGLHALVKRAVSTVRLDLLLGRDARRALVVGPGGIDGESQRQGDGRDRAGSDDLRLMRKGIDG